MTQPISLDIDPTSMAALRAKQAILWLNPGYDLAADGRDHPYDPGVAQARFTRCAPLMARLFPELAVTHGELSSALTPIPALQQALAQGERDAAGAASGSWFLKRDDALPVAGSVKARGGFHEVLALAEQIATQAGLLAEDSAPIALASAQIRELLGQHTVSVGSTGNLGLSIGLISVGLGLRAVVHMSADAKEWKKQRLRTRGIEVIEHRGDYAAAVEAGRATALSDPRIHFIDDEQSEQLFLGYAAAATELAQQLIAAGRRVDRSHPLFVYLPCGVGGAPGGIAYGLKRLFGSDVHCFFAEPVAAPCMLAQLAAGAQHPISVYDLGLDNHTEADGLAVAQASPLIAPIMSTLLAGVFTAEDDTLLRDVHLLERTEGIFIEPSAAAGLRGPLWLSQSAEGRRYLERHALSMAMPQATHVMWSTGGALVPPDIRLSILERGRLLG